MQLHSSFRGTFYLKRVSITHFFPSTTSTTEPPMQFRSITLFQKLGSVFVLLFGCQFETSSFYTPHTQKALTLQVFYYFCDISPNLWSMCTAMTIPCRLCRTHTYLAGEIPWSRRRFTFGEAQPLHSGCADPDEFPKCGNLNCIISGSGGLRSRSPLLYCWKDLWFRPVTSQTSSLLSLFGEQTTFDCMKQHMTG